MGELESICEGLHPRKTQQEIQELAFFSQSQGAFCG